jgi:hypothetical protein
MEVLALLCKADTKISQSSLVSNKARGGGKKRRTLAPMPAKGIASEPTPHPASQKVAPLDAVPSSSTHLSTCKHRGRLGHLFSANKYIVCLGRNMSQQTRDADLVDGLLVTAADKLLDVVHIGAVAVDLAPSAQHNSESLSVTRAGRKKRAENTSQRKLPVEAFVVEVFPDFCLVINSLHAQSTCRDVHTASTSLCSTTHAVPWQAPHGGSGRKEGFRRSKEAYHNHAHCCPSWEAHPSHFFLRVDVHAASRSGTERASKWSASFDRDRFLSLSLSPLYQDARHKMSTAPGQALSIASFHSGSTCIA